MLPPGGDFQHGVLQITLLFLPNGCGQEGLRVQGPLPAASASHTTSHFLLVTTPEGRRHHSHFVDWEMEPQRNVVMQLQ